ncbi:MAG: CNNM domain-containing protein [Rhodothermales bacterium]
MDPDPPSLLLFLQSFEADLAAAPSTLTIEIIIFGLMLLASAFVSGSEVALFSLDDGEIESFRKKADRASERVLYLLDHAESLLVTILILNNVINVAAVTLAAVITLQLAHAFEWSRTAFIFGEVIVVTFVLLIVGEMSPKLTAANHTVRYSRFASGPLKLFHDALKPLSKSVSGLTHFVQRRLPARDSLTTLDVKRIAEVGEAHGGLAEDERVLIHSIVELGDTAVREIMISRMDIVAVPDTAGYEEVLDIIRSSGHSRLPLYKDDLDNIQGVIYAKDLIPFLGPSNGSHRFDWESITRKPLIVPAGKKLDALLRDFQTKRTHVAIVVDEYGGTAGLVTLEDVLEEIVGDIQDEYDYHEKPLFRRVAPDTIVADAKIDLDDLNEALARELDAGEEDLVDTTQFGFETLGGLVFHLTESIPSEGDQMTFENLLLTVESVVNHRIGRVKVQLRRLD